MTRTASTTCEIQTVTGTITIDVEFEYDEGEPSTPASFAYAGDPGAAPSVERVLSAQVNGLDIEEDGVFALSADMRLRWATLGDGRTYYFQHDKNHAIVPYMPVLGELMYPHPMSKSGMERMRAHDWATMGYVSRVVPVSQVVLEACDSKLEDLMQSGDMDMPDVDEDRHGD